MAVEPFTFDRKAPDVEVFTWTALGAGDTGRPIQRAQFSDKTFQAFSADWLSTTLTVQGSNDPRADETHADHANAVWTTIKDSAGANIAFTANGGATAVNNYLWVRPSCAGGTATAITLICVAKRTS
jgi:hypothetical protein